LDEWTHLALWNAGKQPTPVFSVKDLASVFYPYLSHTWPPHERISYSLSFLAESHALLLRPDKRRARDGETKLLSPALFLVIRFRQRRVSSKIRTNANARITFVDHPTNDGPLIYVHDLCKHFRSFRRREGLWGSIQNLFVREYKTVAAVDRVGFSIERGESVGYIGPNGAGKSTTIKMLTGILVPTSGDIRINGFVPHRQRRDYVKTIGVVFGQRTQLWWDIAVIESFKLLRRIYDVSQRDFDERMERFNEVLNIRDYLYTPVRKLSLGERMRCDLAAALLHNPPLLFLDEPTIGLDVVAKDRIRHFLHAVNRDFRTTILLTTHDLDDIEELCRRIMIIDHGRVLYDGPLDRLKEQLLRTKQVKFVLKDTAHAVHVAGFDRDGLEVVRVDELTFRIRFDRHHVATSDLIRQILSAVDVRDLLIEDEPIEEIIKRIYAGEASLELSAK
jgi:ABC-2 type transport system ATP-binding protein